jgi:hypothetical protein
MNININIINIADLWVSTDPNAWEDALARYWKFVPQQNMALNRSFDALDLGRLRRLGAREWYNFLIDEYFCWKYNAPNRYKTTTKHLRRYVDDDSLGELDQIRRHLLTLDTDDILSGLKTARAIRGLGTAGASGLLALMYPQRFGTVDQFVVKALRQVNGLLEAEALARMNPENLTIRDGVVIIDILRRKAADNNRVFASTNWTPRKLDKILWTYRPPSKRNGIPHQCCEKVQGHST